jgi:hypothetical protein
MLKKQLQGICLLLAAMLLLASVGCTGSEVEPEATSETTVTSKQAVVTTTAGVTTTTKTETTTQAVEENPFEEFYEISWIFGFCDTYVEGAYDELMIEERYNIDLKCWNISYYDTEGLTMMLAAGDIPDFSNLARGGKTPQQLYEEGYTRSVSLDMYKKVLPLLL